MVTADLELELGTDLHEMRRRRQALLQEPFEDVDTFEGVASDPTTLHKYLYANANPIRFTDPTGQFSCAEALAATGVAAILASLIGGGIGLLSSAPRSSLRTSTVAIHIYIDRATKPANFNTAAVEARLNASLTSLKPTAPGKALVIKVRERDRAPTPVEGLGWQYDRATWGYNTGGMDLVPIANVGYNVYKYFAPRRKEQYVGWVFFNPSFPSFARTQDAQTEINPARIAAKATELGINVNWDQAYANFLAHEQIYLGAYEAFGDSYFADNGSIQSGHAFLVDPVDVPVDWARKFRDFLGLD